MMQWPIPRTLAVSMLLLSLGIVGWTGYAFFKSLGDNVRRLRSSAKATPTRIPARANARA